MPGTAKVKVSYNILSEVFGVLSGKKHVLFAGVTVSSGKRFPVVNVSARPLTTPYLCSERSPLL